MCRFTPPLALASILLAAALLPSRAAEKDPAAEFELRSALLTRVPDVAAALERVDADSGDVEAWRALGQALANRAAYIDAVNALDVATQLDPGNPDVWVDLGAVHLRADDPDRALGVLKKALEIEPFHAIAHYDMGLAYQAQGNRDAAFDSFEYALTIDPALGDPKSNPAAVVNPDLPYVKLRVFMKTTGSSPALYGFKAKPESAPSAPVALAAPAAPASKQQQPAGTQPAGTQPAGTQPAGTQPAGTQPADAQPPANPPTKSPPQDDFEPNF